MLYSFLLATFLAILGLGLVISHFRAWTDERVRAADERGMAFARRKFRRRTQASSLLILLGVAIAAGELVTSPLANLCYWFAVFLLLLWIVVLAILDLAACQQYFGLQRSQQVVEEALLRRQMAGSTNQPGSQEQPLNKNRKGAV